MGVDPEAEGDEADRADADGSRLPRLDSTERDSSSSQAVSKQEQHKQISKEEEQERKVQDFRRPAAVVGISARYVPGSMLYLLQQLSCCWVFWFQFDGIKF
jgi:hypothetical protein